MTKYEKELEIKLIEEIEKDTRIFSLSKLFKIWALESMLAR